MAGVAIVAGRGRHGDAELLLSRKTLHGLLRARMRLQRKRFVGGEHLEQKRQCVAEPAAHTPSELSLRIFAQGVEQRPLTVFGLQPRRVAGMGAEPQLCLGMRCGAWPSGEIGNCCTRTPCIGPHRST